MQPERSHGPVEHNDKGGILRRHRPALVLWAVMLASFLLAVLLYAAFSEPYLLRVYEFMQVHRAQVEGHSVDAAIIDYEDYLRVDPESIRVRGLIVNAFIELQEFERAEEHAKSGLNRATEEQRPLAWLIAARVYLARDDIDEAAPYVQKVLDATPHSGEGHYQMAQLLLARGQFIDADQEFVQLRSLGPRDSTREYIEEWNSRSKKLAGYQREIEAGIESTQRSYELGMEFQKMGRLYEAQELYSRLEIGAGVERASSSAFEIAAFESMGLDTVYVDFAFDGVELGTPLNPYNTLTEALVAAKKGATISLKAGSSAEPLTIDRSVTLQPTGGSIRIGRTR